MINETGCVCCRRKTTKAKMTRKPVMDKARLACSTLGINRIPRKRGKTDESVRRLRTAYVSCSTLPLRIAVTQYMEYSCTCEVWNESSANVAIPETDATTAETPEQRAMVQPKRFIQPTTKAANLLYSLGASI